MTPTIDHAVSRSRARLAFAIVVGVLAAACSRKAADTTATAANTRVVVTLQPSVVRPMQRTVDVVGTLRGAQEATLSAKVQGRIIGLTKDLGDVVAADEVLAQLDPVEYELQLAEHAAMVLQIVHKIGLDALPAGDLDVDAVPMVERASLQVKNELAKYDRGKQLFAQDPPVISDQDLADLETVWQVAVATHRVEVTNARALVAEARTHEAERKSAAQRLAETVVHAPAGAPRYAIARRYVDVGEFVKEGDPLFEVVVADPIELRADVPERYGLDVRLGQHVRIHVEAVADTLDGVVMRVAPMVDPASRTFRVEIRSANADGKLVPGAFARASIDTRVDAEVTLVPIEAVATFVGETKVFTVENGAAVEHRVRTGTREGDLIEIVDGLSGVHPLVVTGLAKIADRTAVDVKTTADLDGPPIDRAGRDARAGDRK